MVDGQIGSVVSGVLRPRNWHSTVTCTGITGQEERRYTLQVTSDQLTLCQTESLVGGPEKASVAYSLEEAKSQIQRYTDVQSMLGVYPVLAKLVQYAIMYLDRSRCRGK